MPIYEYVCRACGGETEVIHKMSDPPATACPACGKPALEKMMSASGFRLGGSGWYETDFKKGEKKNLVADKSDPAAKADSDKKDKPVADTTAKKDEAKATPAPAPVEKKAPPAPPAASTT